MRIVCISDLHGRLPQIPKCDLLVIGGDICPDFFYRTAGHEEAANDQYRWLDSDFREWLEYCPALNVVATLGNHDVFGPRRSAPPGLRWHLLLDEELLFDPGIPHGFTEPLEGAERPLRVYGTPHSLPFGFGLAYMENEPTLSRYWDRIPDNLDILIVHGPPDRCGDRVSTGQHVGSVGLRERIWAAKAKLVITGHIHEARGIYRTGESVVLNASLMDEYFAPTHKPWVATWEDGVGAINEAS
jgi:Icc-related predicted phosphoesterase